MECEFRSEAAGWAVVMGAPMVMVWAGTLAMSAQTAHEDAPTGLRFAMPVTTAHPLPANAHREAAAQSVEPRQQSVRTAVGHSGSAHRGTHQPATSLTPIVIVPGFPVCQIEFNMPLGTKLPPSYAQCRSTTNGWETLSPPPTNLTLDQVSLLLNRATRLRIHPPTSTSTAR